MLRLITGLPVLLLLSQMPHGKHHHDPHAMIFLQVQVPLTAQATVSWQSQLHHNRGHDIRVEKRSVLVPMFEMCISDRGWRLTRTYRWLLTFISSPLSLSWCLLITARHQSLDFRHGNILGCLEYRVLVSTVGETHCLAKWSNLQVLRECVTAVCNMGEGVKVELQRRKLCECSTYWWVLEPCR